MTPALKKELAVATQALEKGLVIARSRFLGTLSMTVKDATGDLVSEVDLLCESEISDIISHAFPTHGIVHEETPDTPSDSPCRWVIDPLDDTNNYVYGLPLWGIAISLCYQGSPVLSAIADGYSGRITLAVSDSGVIVDGQPWTPPLSNPGFVSSAFWIGYHTDRSHPRANQVLRALYSRSRRVFENWAPTVDAGLFLRGGIDVIVGQDCSGTELPAALLVLQEAGASIIDVNGRDIDLRHIPPFFIAGRPWAVGKMASSLSERTADV